ncbi:MAG: class I SAM-dependent methyltransferase [Actinobacteria bacterium]|nr:class I SAM-dependent methyltransferase [Actinomycetota bacterium]
MPAPDKQIIDVERLVTELKERVARERAAGGYGDDLSGVALEAPPPMRDGIAHGFDLVGGGPRVRFRPELGFSSKPVVGPVITLVKGFFLRLIFFVMDDMARQADTAITRLESALAAEASAREAAETEVQVLGNALDAQRHALDAEIAARKAVQTDVGEVADRAGDIRSRLERLQLESRLARLERGRRAPAAPSATSGEAPPPSAVDFDYETFEARFRPEESVRERQQQYVELLKGQGRVADLGCGRGELIELLKAEGVDAYGVEIDPDFISLLEEKGVEVIAKDAVTHLAELDPESLGGVVGSHLVEHLPPAALTSLVSLAGEKLATGGILILETPNPESLVAGSINFHRDLTHVRPIHPDTLAFLAESAGFSKVEVRRLSPVPQEERLPVPGDGRLDAVVERLNDLLYGYQDYAIVARK